MHRTSVRTLGVLVHLLAYAPLAGAQQEAQLTAPAFIPARRFPEMASAGIPLPDAAYDFWVWARAGAEVALASGGQEYFSDAPGTHEHPARFQWRRLGRTRYAGAGLTVTSTPDNAVACLCVALPEGPDVPGLWELMWSRSGDASALADPRVKPSRHINAAYDPWTFPDRAAWEKRAAWLRTHTLTACGLWPPPVKTPLDPIVSDRMERGGYTIEKAAFQSWPGFYVTGNLYRPRGGKGPYPAVLCPHGHWSEGRFTDKGEPEGGVQPRAITLARLGCVVFSYDMVGYGDSQRQVPHTLAGEDNELWGSSLMKLQLWNAIRGLDFLASLEDVDAERLAVTGASGGGTQTFMLMAVDPRVKAAAPVCMVSAFMQGGCECENAPLLRLDTINPEITALMAPRPLLMVSATGDWTSRTPQVEYPMVRGIYALYGAEDRVSNRHFEAPHNYNRRSREAVYDFLLTHLMDRGAETPFAEPPYTSDRREDLGVWAGRELPPEALDRAGLEKLLREEVTARLAAYAPRDAAALERFRADIGAAYRHTIYVKGRAETDDFTVELLGATPFAAPCEGTGLRLLLTRNDQRVPALLYLAGHNAFAAVQGRAAALVVHPRGKAALADTARGGPGALVAELLARKVSVLAIDAFGTGEHHSPFALTSRTPAGRSDTTYNRSILVERVRDIVLGAEFLRERIAGRVTLIGEGHAGKWTVLAGPFLGADTAVIADLDGYRSGDESAWRGEDFTPHILAVGGLRTAASLCAPRTLVCHSVGSGFHGAWPMTAYGAARAADRLQLLGHALGTAQIAQLAAWD